MAFSFKAILPLFDNNVNSRTIFSLLYKFYNKFVSILFVCVMIICMKILFI